MAAETPTIVLVHGAWTDATGFDTEMRALGDRGYSTIGFGNPLRDLAGDAAYLADSCGAFREAFAADVDPETAAAR